MIDAALRAWGLTFVSLIPVADPFNEPLELYKFRVKPPVAGHWMSETFGHTNPCMMMSTKEFVDPLVALI